MRKSAIQQEASDFDEYIKLVPDLDLADAFQSSILLIENLDLQQANRVGNQVYAPGKWTIKQILQHLIDEERVMTYRALLLARQEKEKPNLVDLVSFNQQASLDDLVNDRTIESLQQEYLAVRKSTVYLFNSFKPEVLLRKGSIYIYQVSVLSIGFFLIGHQLHHFRFLEEKYFNI